MSHYFIAGLGLHGLVLASTKKSSTSGYSSIIFIVFILVIGYFLLIRPQRARARRQQTQAQEIGVGDRVMLTSGIIGRVTGFNGDRARVEVSNGIEIEVVRRAISQRLTDQDGVPDIPSEPTQPDPGADDDGHYPHLSDELPHEVDSDGDDAGDEHDDDVSNGAAPDDGSWPATAVHPDAPRRDRDGGGVPGGGLGDGGTSSSSGGDSVNGSSAESETGKA